VWSGQWVEQGQRLFYHLGKATNGAVMGRDPARHKPLSPERSLLAHLEAHLRKIIPAEATFLWLAATECGRPVSAKQGYSLAQLPGARKSGNGSGMSIPLSFKATGGCGLGGNTAIIPEVQAILDRRGVQGQR
jgi:hypothetical protein